MKTRLEVIGFYAGFGVLGDGRHVEIAELLYNHVGCLPGKSVLA